MLFGSDQCTNSFLNDAALEYFFKIAEADFKKAPAYGDYKRGHAFEAGMFIITKNVLDYIGNPETFKRGLELTTEVIHKGGLTTIGEQGYPQIDLALEEKLYSNEFNKNSTPFRYLMVPNAMYLYPRLKSGEKVLAFCDSLIKTPTGPKQGWVKAIKFYVDGAIFSQMMQMSEPYEDNHKGAWMMQPAEQEDVFNVFWKAGWDIHIHVNGDAGLDTLFSIMDRVKMKTPQSKSRIIMEHYGYARQAQHEKVAAAGIWVSNNPYYYYELSAPYK
ncbi:MAG: amidohydrolase family protein [Flavobacteriaceae bacterium]|nr:amidohydrolase family protein [Flavobacteriaceae bacterium]